MSNNFFSGSAKSVFFLALPLMGACSWAGQMAKDRVEGVASYYGSEHFTLVASVPPNFGFTSEAQYSPKAGQDCKVYSPGLGGSVTRQQQKSDKFPAKNTEQKVTTEIPLEYHIGGCSMALTRVNYEVNATYGTDDWDQSLDHAGGLSIVNAALNNSSTSSSSEQRGLCTWLFQISTAKAKKGQIEKILSCTSADTEWKIPEDRFKRRKPGAALVRGELADKIIPITFRLSSEEKPGYQAYWYKVPNGWKPCTGRWNSESEELCTTPPKFRTFKMNGHECSVYPGCNE